MKYAFLLLFSLIIAEFSYAQDVKVDTIYYDNGWKVVPSKYIADYFRVKVDSEDARYKQFRDYYITGEQQGRGRYISIDSLSDANSLFDGECLTYYKNGDIASVRSYNRGRLFGEYIEYSQDGQVKRHANFDNGLLDGTQTEFDDDRCTQIEYKRGVPAESYTISNSDGCLTTYNTSSGEPIWLSPTIDEKKIEYKDGVKWQYYVKNGLTIYLAKSNIKDYGKYYKLDLLIANNSLETITFEPIRNMTAVAGKATGTIYFRRVLSNDEYIKEVRSRQKGNAILMGIFDGLAIAAAGHSTAVTNTYSRHGRSTSVTHHYDAGAKYQSIAMASERAVNLESAQKAEREIKNVEYLKKTTIYPYDVVAGYVNIDRENSDTALKIVIDINGAEYVFGDAYLTNETTGELPKDLEPLKSYSGQSLKYKTKHKECQIESIDIYKYYTLVTFRYTNYSSGGTCSLDQNLTLSYMDYSGYWTPLKMVKSENMPLQPNVHQFSDVGEELVYQVYFPAIPERTKFLEINRGEKDKMQWKNITLRNYY